MPHTPTAPTLAYDTDGSGPPVLLVMGFTMRGVAWRPQVEGLSDAYTLAWFDHRGVGDSATATPFTMADLGHDALRVADALGWDRFHLVGVSMGGMAAQELVLGHPDRVGSLTLIATQPGGPFAVVPPPRALPLVLSVGLARGKTKARLTDTLLHPKGSLQGRSPEALASRFDDVHGRPPGAAARRAQLRAVRRHDTRDRLHRIAAPTLVVQPGRDKLCRPGHSDRLAREIPDARLARLPDAGHGLIFHAADTLNTLLREHFEAHPL